MGKHRIPTVTQGDWGVSTETSSAYTGATLHVYRLHDHLPNSFGGRGKFQHGEAYGKRFPTSEDASAYAREHGYTEAYYSRVWCRKHRCLHEFLGHPSPALDPDKCTRDASNRFEPVQYCRLPYDYFNKK